jgi:hypothetical protein
VFDTEIQLGFLKVLCDELQSCVGEFRDEKKTGQLIIHFSQGEIASVEVLEDFNPPNRVGSFSPAQCSSFAVRKVRWFMIGKRSGHVCLVFEQGDIASVRSFIRLSPGRKRKSVDNAPQSS